MSRTLRILTLGIVTIVVFITASFFAWYLLFVHENTSQDPSNSTQLPRREIDYEVIDTRDVGDTPSDVPIMSGGRVIDSFAACAAAGYPVQESYPATCRASGVTFTQKVEARATSSGESAVACTADAKLCPNGSTVGRTGPDCTFTACPSEKEDDERHICTPEEKRAEFCSLEYAPVCGLQEVQCVTEPCEPVPETFSNGCMACSQGNVVSYTEGVCGE